MSKKNQNKKKSDNQNSEKSLQSNVVKMRFKEAKFYNDLSKPLYLPGEVYQIEGADMIQRWLKRGGEIVEGKLEQPPHVVNESKIVDNKSEVVSKEENLENNQKDSDLKLDEKFEQETEVESEE